MSKAIVPITLLALMLAACSSAPTHQAGTKQTTPSFGSGGGFLSGDGPGAADAAKLSAVPDAVPRPEPLHRYANRPYEALGKKYVPLTAPGNYRKRGMASWYGKKFHGQRTSSGEVYDMYAMSAAHPTLPIPSYARVTNVGNGKSVVVRVNDRGPFLHERIMDVSYAAAYKLGILGSGSAEVEVESLVPGHYVPPPVAAEPVRVEPVAPEPAPVVSSTVDSAAGRVFLQLGSFHSPQGAESFLLRMRDELADLGKQVVLYRQGGLARVHLGPYRTADEARAAAERLQSRLGFKPFVSWH